MSFLKKFWTDRSYCDLIAHTLADMEQITFPMARSREFDIRTALDQAMMVFWNQGFKGSSLQDLIRAMGISKSSFYETFGSKRELFLATIKRFRDSRAIYNRPEFKADLPVKTVISGLFDFIIDSVIDRQLGCMFGRCALEFFGSDDEVTKQIASGVSHLEVALCQLIERGQASGEISADKDPLILARQLTTTFYGLQVLANAGPERQALKAVAAAALKILD